MMKTVRQARAKSKSNTDILKDTSDIVKSIFNRIIKYNSFVKDLNDIISGIDGDKSGLNEISEINRTGLIHGIDLEPIDFEQIISYLHQLFDIFETIDLKIIKKLDEKQVNGNISFPIFNFKFKEIRDFAVNLNDTNYEIEYLNYVKFNYLEMSKYRHTIFREAIKEDIENFYLCLRIYFKLFRFNLLLCKENDFFDNILRHKTIQTFGLKLNNLISYLQKQSENNQNNELYLNTISKQNTETEKYVHWIAAKLKKDANQSGTAIIDEVLLSKREKQELKSLLLKLAAKL